MTSKNQRLVPREALGGQPGDKLLVVVRGQTVVILPRPRSICEGSSRFSQASVPGRLSHRGARQLESYSDRLVCTFRGLSQDPLPDGQGSVGRKMLIQQNPDRQGGDPAAMPV